MFNNGLRREERMHLPTPVRPPGDRVSDLWGSERRFARTGKKNLRSRLTPEAECFWRGSSGFRTGQALRSIHPSIAQPLRFSLMAACAAARRAIGTRKGEQET